MFLHIEELFPLLLSALSDSSDKVIHCNLKVLSEIISSPVFISEEQTAPSEFCRIYLIFTIIIKF